MKDIFKLCFLTLGMWKLKYSNDINLKFGYLEIKERNTIIQTNQSHLTGITLQMKLSSYKFSSSKIIKIKIPQLEGNFI